MAPDRRLTGDVRPRSQGGDFRSHRIEAHAGEVLTLIEELPDIGVARPLEDDHFRRRALTARHERAHDLFMAPCMARPSLPI